MNEEIIAKLKKLLRLGQSSNQHEAELAIERAFELASRHNIDLASVDVDEQTRRLLHKRFKIGQRLSLVRKLAIQLVHNYFNVHAIVSRPDVVFIGTEADVEIAHYVVDFIVSACTRSLRAFQKEQTRKLTETKRRSFVAGFVYGLSFKLNGARKQFVIDDSKTALITAEEARRKKYMEENFQTHDYSINVGRRNRNAMMAGHVAGRETEINKGVANKRMEGRLLNA